MRKLPTPENDRPISFKLESEFWAPLQKEAKRENESVHLAARRLMLRALAGDGMDELKEEMAELRLGLKTLHEHMVTILRPILARSMGIDAKAVDAWLREHLGL